jgi:hypothetical protein
VVASQLGQPRAKPVETAPAAARGLQPLEGWQRLRALQFGRALSYTYPVMLSHSFAFLGRPLMRVSSLERTVWK